MSEDGGPAFPRIRASAGGRCNESQTGMSLRDYFAGKCMSDVLNHFSWTDAHIAEAAKFAYKLADAMISERNKV